MNELEVPAELLAMLRRHEGFVPHAYQDHLGYLTIGYGRLIDERRGGGITTIEGSYLLRNDAVDRMIALDERLPWWRGLDEARRIALLNMAYQLGVDGLLGFRNTLKLLENGRYDQAGQAALNSLWARQTPKRAEEIARILRTGELP